MDVRGRTIWILRNALPRGGTLHRAAWGSQRIVIRGTGGAVNGVIGLLLWGALLMGWGTPLGAQEHRPPETDWPLLRESIVEIRVLVSGQDPKVVYGFALEGIPGIVTCRHLVAGAEEVLIRTRGGDIFESQRYVAHDPALDLVIIDTQRELPPLKRGTHRMFAQRQIGLVPLPPSVGQDVYSLRFLNEFLGRGVGELLACWGDISPGLPYADSLGAAVGVIQVLTRGADKAVCVVPIERVAAMMGRPAAGGLIADLPTGMAAYIDPGTSAGAQVMGAVLCRARRFSEGLSYLMQALEKDPQNFAAKLEWGMALQFQRDFAAAESMYREALELAPQNARAHLYLGSCYFMQGKYAEAGVSYEKAMDADPTWPLPWINMGGLRYLQGFPAEAEQYMKRALEMDPQMGLAHFNLGMLYYANQRAPEGESILRFLRARRTAFADMLVERVQ